MVKGSKRYPGEAICFVRICNFTPRFRYRYVLYVKYLLLPRFVNIVEAIQFEPQAAMYTFISPSDGAKRGRHHRQ